MFTRSFYYRPSRSPSKAKRNSPLTRVQWAEFYAKRDTEQAMHLCLWYLLLDYAEL